MTFVGSCHPEERRISSRLAPSLTMHLTVKGGGYLKAVVNRLQILHDVQNDKTSIAG